MRWRQVGAGSWTDGPRLTTGQVKETAWSQKASGLVRGGYETGAEGRISHLKRRYALDHSRLKGHQGQQIWTEWGILAYNVDTLAMLTISAGVITVVPSADRGRACAT